MIPLARRHSRWLIAGAALVLVCALRVTGHLVPLENAVADARARVLSHEVDSGIVIVGIDQQSLRELDVWPWPRSLHAELLDRINAADAPPRRVFFDIDFSSPQADLNDMLLQKALERTQAPVLLPAFLSPASTPDSPLLVTRPLPRFEREASLVSVNRLTGEDGFTRSWSTHWPIDGLDVPSVIDPVGKLGNDRMVPIDYTISPSSFGFVSYVDLLEGRYPAERLAGKDVFIGNVSIELGDMVAVPVHGSLPGVVVQAMATETVTQGVSRPLPAPAAFALLIVWAAVAALVFRGKWLRNLGTLGAMLMLIAGLSVAAFAWQRLRIEAAAPMVMMALTFLGVTLRSLDRQTTRALAFALGMRRRDALLKSIVQSSADCIVCIDAYGIIRTANPAASELFGCSMKELIDQPIGRFLSLIPVQVTSGQLAALHGYVRECDARPFSGESFPVEVSVSRVKLNNERLFTAFVRDIRERRAQQERLQHQATHDSLTGLPNRAALIAHLDQAFDDASRSSALVLLMLDLCRFKEVNDALGHHVGDRVLCEVAKRFAASVGQGGFIARMGGDEFTVVMQQPKGKATIESMANELANGLRVPIEVAGIAIEVGVSVGVAFGSHAGDGQTLLRHADIAMYSSKRRGTAFEYYDAAEDDNTVRRLAIGGELRTAIMGHALALHFQPQVNLATGLTESCEALVRWFHPTQGSIPPSDFISIAEATDLIRPLTEWTLSTALNQIRTWRECGLRMRVAVNLSARVLQDTAFPEHLRRLLEEADVPADLLELEITESAMMIDPARALQVIQQIHKLGVMIAIDDFGTGYSSLSYLRDLPVQALKLDKSFVKGMRGSDDDRVIVESTARMAHALKLYLVAEGVEGEWEAHFLAAAGYDYAQGFRYAGALDAEQFFSWVTQFNAAALMDENSTARIHRAAVRAPAVGELRKAGSLKH